MSVEQRANARGAIKLNIACGQEPLAPFREEDHDRVVGIDLYAPQAQVTHDLTTYPWPLEDSSAQEAFCSHYVEHIPLEVYVPTGEAETMTQRKYDKIDGLLAFMDEVWRVLEPNGEITIIYPHSRSDRAFQDPTHRRFIPEATWFYFSREWREANKLDHYPVSCDFAPTAPVFYTGWQGDWGSRSEPARAMGLTHYWNVASDVVVKLRAIKA